MPTDCISYRDTGYFSPLICDYLDQKEALSPFYHRFPELENFKTQLEEKGASFDPLTRKVLADALHNQYAGIATSEETEAHIEALRKTTTFTITTGHQLNLFTGPLYFLYKIISVINLTRQLKAAYPAYDFVPVYWMASEDHDFEEINYFRFRGSKVQWNRNGGGAVGDLSTEGLHAVFEEFSSRLGPSKNADHLRLLFTESYLQHKDLTATTRHLANTLFSAYGLVIVDGNDSALKTVYAPYMRKELETQITHSAVVAQTTQLNDLGYPEQVYPREINLFYLDKGLRERIVKEGEDYIVNGTAIRFSASELIAKLDAHPEQFSPNALLRPLYQEVILPNLCYIGGGGELAYWFQLKTTFKAFEVPFPMLLLRNSAVLQTAKEAGKTKRLGLGTADLFQKQTDLVNGYVRRISEVAIDFSQQRTHLTEQFKVLYKLAEQTDASFRGAVAAQEKKQLKGLDHLEKRLLKAQKRKLDDMVKRLTDLQNGLFPGESLQERNTNFAVFYLEYGETLIPALFESLNPLDIRFTVVTL